MSNENNISGAKNKGQPVKPARKTVARPIEKKSDDLLPTTSVSASISAGGDADEELVMESIGKPTKSKASEMATPRRPAMKGGWADMRTSRRGDDDGEDDRRLRPRSPQDNNADSDNDIPMIPEIEDSHVTSSSSSHVVMAPLVAVNRITTYKELDGELSRHVAFLSLDNQIDLKLLSNGMSAEADLAEEDEPWEWDQLFTEVTSELTSEWDSHAAVEEKASAAVAVA